MTSIDDLAAEIAVLREEIARASRSPYIIGTVTARDQATRTVTISDSAGQVYTSIPVQGSALPGIGTSAVVVMNGAAPLAQPGHGAVTQQVGYVAGVSGYALFDDGSAEFNNVVVRGTLDAGYVRAGTITKATVVTTTATGADTPLDPGGVILWSFDGGTVESWTGSNATLANVATPVQSGAGALRLTSVAAGVMSATSPTGTSGKLVQPGEQYVIRAYVRTAVTARNVKLQVAFYDSTGAQITTWGSGGWQGDTVGANNTTTYVQRSAYATVPPNAVYAAVRVLVSTPAAASEIHYVDQVTAAAVSTVGACPDADFDGAYLNDEPIVTPNDTWLGGVGVGDKIRIIGQTTGASSGCVNVSCFTPNVTPGVAYEVASTVGTVSANTIAYRLYAAWYSVAGALLGVSKGRAVYPSATTAIARKEVFVAPASAYFCYAGVTGEATGLATGRGVTGWVDAITLSRSTVIEAAAPSLSEGRAAFDFPVGFAVPYFGPVSVAQPEPVLGWVVGDGRAISRTKYESAWALFGTMHGAGDGSTTFNVPDLRGRVPVGLDNMGGTQANRLTNATSPNRNVLGGSGGSEQLQQHLHTINNGRPDDATSTGSWFVDVEQTTQATQSGPTTDNAGTGASQNMQPYIVCNWLVKT